MLLGAPAIVLAVNRYAEAELQVRSSGGWTVDSSIGLKSQASTFEELLTHPDNRLLRSLFESHSDLTQLPQHALLSLDTSSFYQNSLKLGIGSSASILVAVATLFQPFKKSRWNQNNLIKIHNTVQQSNGSGLDVAAALHGGVIKYQKQETSSLPFNLEIHMSFVFTHSSSSTGPMLQRFSRAMDKLDKNTVDIWVNIAGRVAENYENTQKFLEHLHDLNQFVRDFDRLTGIGIYSTAHQDVDQLASKHNVLYKPSGAGGGDIGIAFSDDPAAITQFEHEVSQHNLSTIPLSVATHGAICEL